jgi:hypothetical protein
MLDPDGDRYLRLNETGGMLWEELAEPTTVAALATHLAERTGIERERAANDAAAFVQALLDLGAVKLEGEGASPAAR